MQNKITYLELDGIKYPIIFTLNVMEAIQEAYTTLDNWLTLCQNEKEPDIKALKFGLKEMINEGIDIENENKEEKMEFVNSKKVGRIITDIGIKEAAKKLGESIIESSKTGDSKNE